MKECTTIIGNVYEMLNRVNGTYKSDTFVNERVMSEESMISDI